MSNLTYINAHIRTEEEKEYAATRKARTEEIARLDAIIANHKALKNEQIDLLRKMRDEILFARDTLGLDDYKRLVENFNAIRRQASGS